MASNNICQDVCYKNDVDKFEFSAYSLHIGKINKSNISCSYYKMHHLLNKCHVVTDIVARKTILQQRENVLNVFMGWSFR